jgi:AcrR family transcriptional regulator
MANRTKSDADPEASLHPNAKKLLDAAVELLEDTPIEQLGLAQVLQRSGVSNGSLYHHFEDFRDLVEHAVVLRFTKGLNDSLAAIASLRDSTDAQDFRRRVENIVSTFHDQNRRPYRMARLETLGALSSRPRLAERIGRAQYESNMKQAEYLAEFQQLGWFRSDLDAAAISTFMTATFIGRVVDDIATQHIDPVEWSRVAMTAFRAILFPPD